MDQPDIENLTDGIEYTDSIILNGIMELLELDADYVINGLIETVDELENDVNTRADTFYSTAHQRYRAFCERIEEAAEEVETTEQDA